MSEETNVKGSVDNSTVGLDQTGGDATEQTYTESEVKAKKKREGDRRVWSATKEIQKQIENR